MPKEAQKQHYVPRFILNRFSYTPNTRSKRIYIYDKWDEKGYENSTKNVGCKNSLYNTDDASLEPALQALDGKTSNVIDKILKAESLSILNQEDHIQLTMFICVQMFRTIKQKDCYAEFKNALYDLAERKTGLRIINGEKEPDEKQDKIFFLKQIGTSVKYLKHLNNKIWSLIKAPDREHFVIGDCPFVKNNMIDEWPRGGLGLACEGIELYLPLSKKITLSILCPTWGEKMMQSMNFYKNLILSGNTNPKIRENYKKAEEMISSMTGGNAIVVEPENILYLNSLQIQQARRYVYSSSNDFKLVQEMIAKHPDIKKGLAMDFSGFYQK